MNLEVAKMDVISCQKCGEKIFNYQSFCSKCGNRIVELKSISQLEKEVFNVFIIFFSQLIFLAILFLNKKAFISQFIVDGFYIVIVFFLSFRYFKILKPSLNFNSFHFKKLLKYIGLQLLITLFTFLMSYLITIFFNLNVSNITNSYDNYKFPILFAIISIAVIPAITEELVFRGILFNQLLKITNEKSVIFITGILFAIIHLNFLGFIWLIPAGIYFGWVKYKEKTIWYGSICHFIHNSICVILMFNHL